MRQARNGRAHGVVRGALPLLLCLALAAPALPSAASPPPPGAASSDEVAARIRRVEEGLLHGSLIKGDPTTRMKLIDRMASFGVPAVSIAVINGYEVEWARAYGVRTPASESRATSETLFQAASISKPLVAVAAMRLVAEGRLALDEDVNRKLRSWKVPENEFTRNSKVTIRGILTHTAGFRIMAFEGIPVGEKLPTALEMLDGRYSGPDGPIRVVYEPGTRSEYSGAGFIVLQQLLEDVTGKPFPKLMDELVLRPAGMKNSTFLQTPPRGMRQRMAEGVEKGKAVPGGWLLKPNMASGGLWTTATDLAKFGIELQKAFSGRPNKLLSPKLARQMIKSTKVAAQPDQRPVDAARGLGLEVRGEGATLSFGHGGNNTGFRSDMILLPDGRGVVVLMNGSGQGLIRELVRAVATEYRWPTPEHLPIVRQVTQVPASVLGRYVGRYQWPEGRRPPVSEVSVEGGRLLFEGVPLLAESPTRFFNEAGATYTFLTTQGGAVEGFRFEVPGLTLTAKKLP